MIFLLDSSNSIWAPNFRRQVEFVQSVVQEFQISDKHIKVGLVTFSQRPYLELSLRQSTSQNRVRKTLKHIEQNGGLVTYASKALEFMRKVCFNQRMGARQNVTKIGIIISDGQSNDPIATAYQANKAKSEGVHLFAIGVGEHIDMNVLEHIASEPHDFYLLTAKGYKGLKHIRSLLAIKTCTGEFPFQASSSC